MDVLRDGVWQFLGVVVGLLGVIVTIVIFQLQKNKKRLAYYILTDTSLLTVDDEIKGKIQINYENKNIQNIRLLILKIENIGNIDISSSDFEQPIIISFPNSEILSAGLIDASPRNLTPNIQIDSSKLTINPILLNKKDFLTYKFIFSDYGNIIDVNSRIIGVKHFEKGFVEDGGISMFDILGILFAFTCGVVALVFIITLAFTLNSLYSDPIFWVFIFVCVTISAFSFGSLYATIKNLIKLKN